MKIERFLTIDQLSAFVRMFMIIDSEQGAVNKLLPSTSVVMVFRYKGSVQYSGESGETSLPTSVLTGLRGSARLIDYASETATLLVIFNAGAAAAFVREPLHELFDVSVSLDNFIHLRFISEIEERLAEAKTNRQRISIIEQFLLSRLNETANDLLIDKAIQRIHSANGTVRIKALATDLGVSQDPFEKRFRRIVGTSPKQFSAIVRLRTIIEQYSPTQSLTETAYRAGYFDQAHFIKDFKAFTGQVPHLFFKTGLYW